MSITNPGADRTGVGFDSPLAMLAECHRRVESQCATLQRMVPHLAQNGSDPAAAEAAQAVLRYFELAAPNHHADEEQDLFPALLESSAGPDAERLRSIVDDLLADHVELEQCWQSLRGVLLDVAAGQPARLDAAVVGRFAQRYAQHIAREEGELMPMAGRLLNDATMDRIGQAMRRRRGDTGLTAVRSSLRGSPGPT